MDFTTKQLDDIWDAQEPQRRAMKKRRRYYDGNHDICGRNAKYADGKVKAEVPTNFAAYVVDLYVGAMTSTDYQLSLADENQPNTIDEYNRVVSAAEIPATDVENLRNALVCGFGLELHEFNDGTPEVISERPEMWALLRDENENIIAAITRFTLCKWSMFQGELLDVETEVMYVYDDLRRVGYSRHIVSRYIKSPWVEFESRPHFYGKVPVVEWKANDERASLLTDAIIAQIDEYNDIDSLSGDDIRNTTDALLKIKGISSTWVKDNETNITQRRILPLPDDADAEYLTKTTDTGRTADRLQRCRRAIHMMAGVPDVEEIVGVTGGTSGIALQLKFMPMQQRAGAMFKHLEKSMRARIDTLNTMLQKAKQTVIENYKVTMSFNMPVNRIEEWSNIGALDGIVTHRTQLRLLTDIDDPDAELAQFEKEQATQGDIKTLQTSPEAQAATQDVAVQQAATQIDGTIASTLNIIGDRILAAATRSLTGASNGNTN